MSVVFAHAPLRISLGGGGTDLPSYYRRHGSFFISAAIDKRAYLMIHTLFQNRYRLKYSITEEVDKVKDIQHPILRESLTNYWSGAPLEISAVADVPAGTGLGSSGAFTVALLKGLAHARVETLPQSVLAERAGKVEMDASGPCGKQDTLVATYGGLCAYTISTQGVVSVEPLEPSEGARRVFRDQFLLFYTGEAHSASERLSDQVHRTETGDSKMIDNLEKVHRLAFDSYRYLQQEDFEGFAFAMDEHWRLKRDRTPGMTSVRINRLYNIGLENGALGGKLLGAGGGGFLLFYTTDPEATRNAMESELAPELPFGFDFTGAYSHEYA